MPYEWIEPASSRAPLELHAWPYRSLSRKGFVIFIASTAVLISTPLIGILGKSVLWVLLPFLILAVGAIWWALERSYRDGSVLEELRIWPDRITLEHHKPGAPSQRWQANPHWIRPELYRNHRIANYLTLRGGNREVELGAFLTADERKQVYFDLNARLADLKRGAGHSHAPDAPPQK